MLDHLTTALKDAYTARDVDYKTMGTLLTHAKGINYGTISVLEDIEKIEEQLETDGVFDLLLIGRAYLAAYVSLSLEKEWWTVVDTFGACTAMATLKATTNQESKEEYYRLYTPSARAFFGHPTQPLEHTAMTKDPLRANDWLAVLWLLSFVPAKWIESLK